MAVGLFSTLSFYSAASAQYTNVTVGYSALSGGNLPAWIGKESGIFRNNGLDVQLVYFRGGTTATMALLSRETPISQQSGPAVVSANLRGQYPTLEGIKNVLEPLSEKDAKAKASKPEDFGDLRFVK